MRASVALIAAVLLLVGSETTFMGRAVADPPAADALSEAGSEQKQQATKPDKATQLGTPKADSESDSNAKDSEPPKPAKPAQSVVKPAAVKTPVKTAEFRPNGRTFVALPASLKSLAKGEVPKSLDQLHAMEDQVNQVSKEAKSCTVGIRIGQAQGSGVIVTEKGYILTAAHVAVQPGKEAVITFSDGKRVKGTSLGMNRSVDAGMIQILPDQNGGKPYPFATLGSSKDLADGSWCLAVGHPGGYDNARGSVLRVGRVLAAHPDRLLTDCALIGGDSGGPLFNLQGELIGIHSRIGNNVETNLHVPVAHYDRAWDRMSSGESWGMLPGFRPAIGVRGKTEDGKAVVIHVRPGSPAEKAGVNVQDVIVKFGDKEITDFDSLKKAVTETMPDMRVPLIVIRGSEEKKLVIRIGNAR